VGPHPRTERTVRVGPPRREETGATRTGSGLAGRTRCNARAKRWIQAEAANSSLVRTMRAGRPYAAEVRRRLFPPYPARVVAFTDAVAIVAFTVAGIVSHTGGLSFRAMAEDALPLLAGWLAAAVTTGLYRRPSLRPLLTTWLLGISAGVALRAAALGRLDEPRQLAFLATTLVLTFVCVTAARLLLWAGSGRQP